LLVVNDPPTRVATNTFDEFNKSCISGGAAVTAQVGCCCFTTRGLHSFTSELNLSYSRTHS